MLFRSEVYDRLLSRPFVSEAKLDGQRAQIHLSLEAPQGDGGRGQWFDPGSGNGPRIWVRMFSKHLEDQVSYFFGLERVSSLTRSTADRQIP